MSDDGSMAVVAWGLLLIAAALASILASAVTSTLGPLKVLGL